MPITFKNGFKNYSDFPNLVPDMITNTGNMPFPVNYNAARAFYNGNTYACDMDTNDARYIRFPVIPPAGTSSGNFPITEACTGFMTQAVMNALDLNKTYYIYRIPLQDASGKNAKWIAITIKKTTYGSMWTITVQHVFMNAATVEEASSVQIAYSSAADIYKTGNLLSGLYFGASYAAIDTSANPNIPESARYVFYFCTHLVNPTSTTPATLPITMPGSLSYDLTHDCYGLRCWPNSSVFGGQVGTPLQYLFFLPGAYVGAGVGADFIETSEETGDVSTPGGYGGGTFDGSSDSINLPGMPSIGVTNVGFVNVYKPSASALYGIGQELFPPLQYTNPTPIPSSSDTAEAIVNGFNSVITFFANIPSLFDQIMANTLINYVIDCHVIPVTPTVGSSAAIQVGPKSLLNSAPKVTSDYVDYDCGDLEIQEFYQNFADYISNAKLYLPFVGFVPIKPEYFQNAALNVYYRFNVIDGSFIAYVRGTGDHVNNGNGSKTILAQYAGNACVHIPITGVTYSNMVSGIVGASAGAVSSAGSGAPAAAITSAITAVGMKGDIAQSNSYSSSAAFLGCRVPYLLIERPVSFYSRTYQHEIGIPANISARLGSLSGFVQMTDVHIETLSKATLREKEIVRKKLAEGIIVS